MNNTQSRILIAFLSAIWISMLIAVFRGWTPGTSKWQISTAIRSDDSGSNRLEVVQNCERHWFNGATSQQFDSVVWKTNGPTGWGNKRVFHTEEFETSSKVPFMGALGPTEIHSFDSAHGRAILKLSHWSTNVGTMNLVAAWYDWDLLNSTGKIVQTCKQVSDPYQPTNSAVPLTFHITQAAGTNVVSLNLPPPEAETTSAGSEMIFNITAKTTRSVFPFLP